MKKIFSLFIVLVLMASIGSLGLAEEAGKTTENNLTYNIQNSENGTEIDEETEEEIEIMNNTYGAQIRLLQLEKAIKKNLLKGERAVEVLQAMEYNTSDLEIILDEMELLLEEVQAADPGANDSVTVFVDLKIDARNLTKEFRDTVKELLSNEKIKYLKEQIKEIESEGLHNYTKRIRNRIKQFNRNQIHRLHSIIGEVNGTLVEQYQNGSMPIDQVKSQISKQINQMAKEKKNKIFSEMIKQKIQKKIQASEKANNIIENFEEREQNRLQNRLQKANNSNDTNLMEQIQNKIANKINNAANLGGSNNQGAEGNNGKGKGKGNS